MNAERFAAIVEAYGGDARRWPAAERAEAEAFGATPQGARLLRRAAALDEMLDAHLSPAPGAELRTRVLEARPGARARTWGETFEALIDFGRWTRAWGAGLAAAGLAGVIFGAALGRGSEGDGRTELLLAETEAYDVAALTAEDGEPL